MYYLFYIPFKFIGILSIYDTLRTYRKLGIRNLFRFGSYKIRLRLGIHSVQRKTFDLQPGFFFNCSKCEISYSTCYLFSYDEIINGYRPFSNQFIYFGDEGPDWHRNYFSGKISRFSNQPWWKIPDFDDQLGDIKTVWELSRFDWVVKLSCWAASGKYEAISVLNQRLYDWVKKNPPYLGINWKCGQEASIRVMHLICASMVLRQSQAPTLSFLDLVEMHLQRIEPTLEYALAQNNNHGTSEAAALFIGGHFLVNNGRKKYFKYFNKGRKYLEERSIVLFDDEGCFSQYSVTYHRVVLDTFSFCETYRRIHELKPFSKKLSERIKKATEWLAVLTDNSTGDAPNLGANDGASLFPLVFSDYRDFRFSVQWASYLFLGYPWFENQEKYKTAFSLIGILFDYNKYSLKKIKCCIEGKRSGIFIFRNDNMLFVFRRPIFNFRPSQSDALHIDLWVDGFNLLRDSGSYSYNAGFDKMKYYSGAESHNTIIIDSTDSMPRLSRFLFGSWLKEDNFKIHTTDNSIEIESGYTDYLGRSHRRSVVLYSGFLHIKDVILGVKEKAIIKWRLEKRNWSINESSLSASYNLEIDFKQNSIIGNFILCSELESRYYLSEYPVNVTKSFIPSIGIFQTKISWS